MQDLSETVVQITQQLGLDAGEIEARQRFLEFGAEYVANRLRVGIAHQRIGLEPKWYIGAYREYLSQLLPLVWDAFDGERDEFITTFDTLLKIIMSAWGWRWTLISPPTSAPSSSSTRNWSGA